MSDNNTPDFDDGLPDSDSEEKDQADWHPVGVPEIILVDNGTSLYSKSELQHLLYSWLKGE